MEVEVVRLQIRGQRYRVLTAGEGLPVLLLHGFTGSGESWSALLAKEAGIQWIAPDSLGHAGTSSPLSPERCEMTEQTADLMAIMAELGHSQFGCCGYSMGGRVALALAVEYPEHISGLVLESASPGLATAKEQEARIQNDERLADKIEESGVEAFIKDWENIPLFASQSRLNHQVLERQRDIRLRQQPLGLANSLRGLGTGRQPSFWTRLHNIQAPTLLITGELDHKFTEIAKRMQQVLPAAEHQTISNAGHTVHMEQPELFYTSVITFFRQRGLSLAVDKSRV